MSENVAARIVDGSRVLVVGGRASDAFETLRARGFDVSVVAEPRLIDAGAGFDVAVVMEFSESWGRPIDVLRELRNRLADGGRVLVSRAGAGPAAVRVTVYGESSGETVGPILRGIDIDRSAVRALGELLASSGLRVVAGTLEDCWVEAVVVDNRSGTSVTSFGSSRDAAPAADLDAVVRAELRELRDFVATVLARQRRLHEELARLRGDVAWRDESLASLRVQLDATYGATALAQERQVQLEACERRLALAEARVADLEARRVRLTDAVIELRERSGR